MYVVAYVVYSPLHVNNPYSAAGGQSGFSGPPLYLLRRSVWGVRRQQQQVVSRGGLRAGSGRRLEDYILKHICLGLATFKKSVVESAWIFKCVFHV